MLHIRSARSVFTHRRDVRSLVGAVFLAAQAFLVILAQFNAASYFSWAPHTTQIRYELEVLVNGRELSRGETRRRFGLSNYGWEAHALQNLKDVLIQHGRTYGRADRTEVILRYSVNGGEIHIWRWPDQ